MDRTSYDAAVLEYKGYIAILKIDTISGILYGRTINMRDMATFQSDGIKQANRQFAEIVDRYLKQCEEDKRKSYKPYLGKFLTRLSPELHRNLSVIAAVKDISMNDAMVAAVEAFVQQNNALLGPR